MTERLDRFWLKGGKWIECPLIGVAEIENGKIKQWHDDDDDLRIRAQMR